MSPTRHSARPGAAGLVLVLALATGCSGAGSPTTADPDGTRSRATTGPSPSSGVSPPSPSATPSSTRSGTGSDPASGSPTPRSAVDLLLDAGDVSALAEDGDGSWSVRDTTVDPVTLGACGRFPLQSIGAEQVLTRSFRPTGDDVSGTVRHAVARFVDVRSAERAESVLRSLHATCDQRLRGATVSAISDALLERGQGSWYVVRSRSRSGAATANALGTLRDGTTIELVELDDVVIPHRHPVTAEPVVRALQLADRRLG